MNIDSNVKPKQFLIDVDGVMTTGHFAYTANGKTMKIFGPDDHDGLSLLKKFIEIRFVTGDKNGLDIIHWCRDHYHPDTKIIMLTGENIIKETAIKIGADYVFIKPHEISDLLNIAKQYQ